jgi:hypothetical protein
MEHNGQNIGYLPGFGVKLLNSFCLIGVYGFFSGGGVVGYTRIGLWPMVTENFQTF